MPIPNELSNTIEDAATTFLASGNLFKNLLNVSLRSNNQIPKKEQERLTTSQCEFSAINLSEFPEEIEIAAMVLLVSQSRNLKIPNGLPQTG